MKGTVLAALAAGAAFLFFRGKKDLINQLEINLSKLKFNKDKSRAALYLNLFFDVQIVLKNPTPQSIKINHIFIEILASGNLIGGVTKPDDFTVSANATSEVNFTAKIQTGGAITTFIAVFQSQQPPVLSAAGYIDTSIGRIPFNKTF